MTERAVEDGKLVAASVQSKSVPAAFLRYCLDRSNANSPLTDARDHALPLGAPRRGAMKKRARLAGAVPALRKWNERPGQLVVCGFRALIEGPPVG